MSKSNLLAVIFILALVAMNFALGQMRLRNVRTCYKAKGVAAVRDARMYDATSDGVEVTAVRMPLLLTRDDYKACARIGVSL